MCDDRSSDICQDLWRICLTGNAENVTAAARCLGQLALHVTSDLSMLESLSRKCFEAVYNIAKKHEQPNGRQLGLLQRSIIVLGAICEQAGVVYSVSVAVANHAGEVAMGAPSYLHHEESVARVNIEDVYTVTNSCFQAICGSTYTAIKYILSPVLPPDEAVRKRAAQALCSVFVGCPRLMILAQADVRRIFHIPHLYAQCVYILY